MFCSPSSRTSSSRASPAPAPGCCWSPFPPPTTLPPPTPADRYRVVVSEARARRLAPHMMDLQMAAADSVGLSTDTDAIVHTQHWLLYQLRLVDGQVQEVEAAIGAVLEGWSAQERGILASFP